MKDATEGTRPMEERTANRGGTLALAVPAILVVITMAVAILAVVVAVGSDDTAGVAAAGEPLVVDVELGDLYVRPSSIEVPSGTELVVRVQNTGAMPHDLKLLGQTGTDLLDPGSSQEVSLGTMTETTQAWCTVPGHKEAGMVLDIAVTGTAPSAGPFAPGSANRIAALWKQNSLASTPGSTGLPG